MRERWSGWWVWLKREQRWWNLVVAPAVAVLLVASLALASSPGLVMHVPITIYEDGKVGIVAVVNNVVHPLGPDGKIVGVLTATNAYDTDINLTSVSLSIRSGHGSVGSFVPDGFIVIAGVKLPLPLLVPAAGSVSVGFSVPFTGSVTSLGWGEAFDVVASLTWMQGTAGPYTYSSERVCTPTVADLGNPQWMSCS
jgi:hypothetical protein